MASLTTKKNYKQKYIGNGKIKRSWDEVTHVEEIIDAVTGKQKSTTVSSEFFSTRKKKKSPREEMIERVKKAVQDLEVTYAFGNALIGRLKNFKVSDKNIKALGKKQFIPDKMKIENLYDQKHGTQLVDKKITPEVLAKEIELLGEVVKNMNLYELHSYWCQQITERYQILKSLKLS